MVDYAKSAAPAAGFDQVRIPGEPERECMTERSTKGIPIDPGSWQDILTAAAKAGMDEERIRSLISGQ